MRVNTKVYCVFPGVGKTHLFNNNNGLVISDSDSSQFSWVQAEGAKVRNPKFPKNYIEHIQWLIGRVDIVLVSTHREVIEALMDAGIDFTLVYPDPSLKSEYIDRYIKRGSPEGFVNLMDEKWDDFMSDVQSYENCKSIKIEEFGKYLSDVISL